MYRAMAMKLLNKLITAGYTDEKAVSSITMDKLDTIPGLTISDVKGIAELQKAIKCNRVIAFLAGTEKEGMRGYERSYDLGRTDGTS